MNQKSMEGGGGSSVRGGMGVQFLPRKGRDDRVEKSQSATPRGLL